ncbi:MAG: hypothetical protein WC201_00245 [Bacilli bacterium]
MKKLNFIILTTTLLGLAGCAGNGDALKSDWSDAEKALLQTYAYGEEIPFIYIDGNEEMYYDTDYNCLTVTGGLATAQQLSDYAVVLDSYGYDGYYDEDNLYYDYIASITTEEGTRYIELQFRCLDQENNAAISGTFMLDVYDPYFYVWEDMNLSTYIDQFSLSSDSVVPSFSASYYMLNNFLSLGLDLVAVYAYGVDASTCEATYQSALLAASWTVEYSEDGYYDAISPTQDLNIQFAYDSSDASLAIYIASYQKLVAFPSDLIADFVTNTLGINDVSIPSLSAELGEIFSYTEYVNDEEYGTMFALSCIDNGTPGTDSLEDTYKGLLEATSWVNTNDETYTYDEYGYFYADSTSQIEIQFYTFSGYFDFYLYAI